MRGDKGLGVVLDMVRAGQAGRGGILPGREATAARPRQVSGR